MGPRRWCPLLLLAAAASLLGGCTDSSSHSLHYFYTTTWDPENLFRFFAVGYLDEQVAVSYNTGTRKAEPRLSWLKKLEKDDPDLWDTNTHIIQNSERRMKGDLRDILNLYHQSTGMCTWQHMNGCELGKDGRKRGSFQYAYNGENFLSFDKETLTWTAAVEPAREIKRRWDANVMRSKSFRSYLEEECVDWLQRYLDYGKGSLVRREPPTVTVARKAPDEGLETLVCQAHGFHPKEIDATWRKDGEVWEQEIFRGGVFPNSDGTYHTWLSIEIHPSERHKYQCHVEHDSLPEPLNVAWEDPGFSKQGVIVLALIVMIDGLLLPLIVRRLRTAKELRRARVYMSVIHALGVSVVYLYLFMLFIGGDQKVEAAKRFSDMGLILALLVLILYVLLDAGIVICFPTVKALGKALGTVSVILALGVSMVLLSLLMLFTGDPKMEAVEASRKAWLIMGVLWLTPGALTMAEIFINSWFRERDYRAEHREPSKDK